MSSISPVSSKRYARLHLGVKSPTGIVTIEGELGVAEDEETFVAWAAHELKMVMALNTFFNKTSDLVYSYLTLLPVHESGRISHSGASWLVLEGDPPPIIKRSLGNSNGRVRRYQA